MRHQHENPAKLNALEPRWSGVSHNDLGILLLIVVLVGAISVLVLRMSSHARVEICLLPQRLVGLVFLVLILALHLASQRKLLRQVSTALIAATSYVNRLEQFSFIDPQTQLFNQRYLEQLFNQQLKWLNRTGESATLLLIEVLPVGQKPAAEEIVIEASFVLRSSFRGSDFVVRNSPGQFLVLLPDTTKHQAQYALNRLTEKVDYWNLQNETFEMVLRHELCTCPPGGNLWEKLREIEERLRVNVIPGATTFIQHKPAAAAKLNIPGEVGLNIVSAPH
jgi:diguanylate cyclase (GGDEF)-like protein